MASVPVGDLPRRTRAASVTEHVRHELITSARERAPIDNVVEFAQETSKPFSRRPGTPAERTDRREAVVDAPQAAAEQRFSTTVSVDRQGRTHVPVPFDPDDVWGAKPRHHVIGSLAGRGLRGVVDRVAGGRVVVLGPAWSGGCGPADGEVVEVVLAPEGPQRGDLAPDVAAALDASPEAAAFFDSLAQFYRKAYLSWIDATRRRPEQRPVRIAEVIGLLERGEKQRPPD